MIKFIKQLSMLLNIREEKVNVIGNVFSER